MTNGMAFAILCIPAILTQEYYAKENIDSRRQHPDDRGTDLHID
jgi:hypothetical protein